MEKENFYIDEYGAHYSNDKLILKHLPNEIKQYTVMDGCTSIDVGAFKECETLEELTLPKSVVLLPEETFIDCCLNLRKLTSFCESNTSNLFLWPLLEDPVRLQELYVVHWEFYVLLREYPDIVQKLSDEELNLVKEDGFVYNSDKTFFVRDESGLEIVNIQEGIERICYSAFKDNTNIKEIIFPYSLKDIDVTVFDNTVNLEKVTICSNLLGISNYVIYTIPSLREIFLSKGLRKEMKNIFYGGLNSVDNYKCEVILEEDYTLDIDNEFEDQGIYERNSDNDLVLTYVPEGVKRYAVKEGVIEIKEDAFRDCNELEELTIPKSVIKLPENVFLYRCHDLRKLTLFVEDIEFNIKNLLLYKPHMEEIHVVPWKKRLYEDLTHKTGYLRIKAISEDKLNLIQENGVVYNSNKKILVRYENKKKNIHIPEGVKAITYDAFKNNLSIEEIVIPHSLEDIHWGAFEHTPNLHKVILLGEQELFEISRIPNLKELYLPNKREIQEFYEFGLRKKECEIKSLDEWLSGHPMPAKENECVYSMNGKKLLSGKECIESIVIVQKGTEEISDYAFEGNNTIEEIVLPRSINEIGKGAFKNCKNLKRVILCNKLTGIIIHFDSFIGCSIEELYRPEQIRVKGSIDGQLMGFDQLREEYELPDLYIDDVWVDTTTHFIYDERNRKKLVYIPKEIAKGIVDFKVPDIVEEIAMRAFDNCISLESITLPDSLNEITGAPFCTCLKLKNIYTQGVHFKDYDGVLYSADKKELVSYPPGKYIAKYEIEEGIATVRDYAFANHDELTIMKLPESLVHIGKWAFSGTRLKQIVIPHNVKIIDNEAFKYSTLLRSVFLGANIEKIGTDAFYIRFDERYETWIPIGSAEVFGKDSNKTGLYSMVEKEDYELQKVQSEIDNEFMTHAPQEKKVMEEPISLPKKSTSSNSGCLGVLVGVIFLIIITLL